MAVMTENRPEETTEVAVEEVKMEPKITFEDIAKVWETDLKVAEKIEWLAEMLLNDDFCTENEMQISNINNYTESSSGRGGKPLRSRVFPLELKPYEFKLVALTYKCEGKTEEETANPLKWHLDRFYEFEYSLGKKVAVLRKNGKELKFSENNITALFAGFYSHDVINWFDTVSGGTTYSDMYSSLGKLGEEQITRIDRALVRFMSVNCLEIIFKTMPKAFASEFAEDIKNLLPTGSDYNPSNGITLKQHHALPYNAMFIDPTGSTPSKILRAPKSLLKLVREGALNYYNFKEIMGFVYNDLTSRYNRSSNEDYGNIYKERQQDFARQCGVLYSVYHEALKLDEEYGLNKAKSVLNIEARPIILAGFNKGDFRNNFIDGTCYFLAKSVNTDFMRMVRYAYYQLEVEQGNSMYTARVSISTRNFSTHYRDYLQMSYQLGTQRDIYPKYLATAHDILARNVKTLEDEMLKKELAIQVENWKRFEDITIRGAKYFIRAPKDLGELTNEATQQHNCVASYARKVAKGQTIILFMREKETPDNSVVTVEVGGDVQTGYYLAQAFRAMNVTITEEQADYLRKWCKKTEVSLQKYVPVANGDRL